MVQPDILAKVYLYPTDQGGRKSPTPSNYIGFPCYFEGNYYDCRLLLDGIGSISPGDTVDVPIIFLYSEKIMTLLKIGSKFKLWEGGFKGEGVVLKILSKI